MQEISRYPIYARFNQQRPRGGTSAAHYRYKGDKKMGSQIMNNAINYLDIFNRQKTYFASNVTKSFEWRLDQL